MNQDYFEKIISKTTKQFNYKEIITNNPNTISYEIQNTENKENYFYKIINKAISKEQFELIINTIKILNKNNFPTAKLLYSKQKENSSDFIFEYLNSEQKEINLSTHNTEILELIKTFYQLTRKIPISSSHTHFKPNKFTIQFKEEYKIQLKPNQLILVDINPSNFLLQNNKLYLIDFDEINFSQIEYDISKIFLNLYYENKPLELTFQKYSKTIKYFQNINPNIDLELVYNLIKLNLIEKTLHEKTSETIKKQRLNNLINLKLNKQKYLQILQTNLNK